MGVASCFGSPLLNDIVGIGVATTIYTSTNGGDVESPLNAQVSVKEGASRSEAESIRPHSYAWTRAYACACLLYHLLTRTNTPHVHPPVVSARIVSRTSFCS